MYFILRIGIIFSKELLIMPRVTDEHIIEFMNSKDCTDIVIERPKQKGGVIYVKYTCSCKRPGSTKWNIFTKRPMCGLCSVAIKKRIPDSTINEYLKNNNLEFISSRRETKTSKQRIFVKFICSCDKDSERRVEEMQWDILKTGAKCTKCQYDRVKATNKKKFGVDCVFKSAEIKEKIKVTNIKKYGVKHVMQNESVKNKIKDTNKERYGVENVFHSEEIRNKIKATNKERYGFEYAAQVPEIREKMKLTNKEKYGVDYPIQNSQIKERIKTTNMERYGFNYPMKNTLVQERRKRSVLAKYGVDYVFQNIQVRENYCKSMLDKYGVEYPMQVDEIRLKSLRSCYKVKTYTFPSGKTILYQGYENFAYDKLIKDGYNENDILSEQEIIKDKNIPDFWYIHNNSKHRYYPDICVKSEKKIIEVKSTWTYTLNPVILDLKVKSVLSANYNVETWVFDSKGNLNIH